MSRSPTGPQPMTAALTPRRTWPRSIACSAIPSGSRSATSSSPIESGTAQEQARRPGHPFPKAAVGDDVAQRT